MSPPPTRSTPPHLAAGRRADRVSRLTAARRAGRGRRPRPGRAPSRSRPGRRSTGRGRRGRARRREAGSNSRSSRALPAASPSGEKRPQLAQVLAVHREQQVEVLEVARADLARGALERHAARARRPRSRGGRASRRRARSRCPALSISNSCSSPASRTSPRMTPSAVGERQMLPMQTKRMPVHRVANARRAGRPLGPPPARRAARPPPARPRGSPGQTLRKPAANASPAPVVSTTSSTAHGRHGDRARAVAPARAVAAELDDELLDAGQVAAERRELVGVGQQQVDGAGAVQEGGVVEQQRGARRDRR